METMEIALWSEFKTLVASKRLSIQYVDLGNAYKICASEHSTFVWIIKLAKDVEDLTNIQDFESNFKAAANTPLENKADVGRPERVAASPQPNNTTEKWKGFHVDIGAGDATKVIDISFDTTVYLKGGVVYSPDCSALDSVKADVVAKANPSYVVKANILDNIFMLPGDKINFMSSECMLMPSTVMLRVTYTKGTPTDTVRSVSAIADYFEVNA